MSHRVVSVAGPASVHRWRGCLLIEKPEDAGGKVPLDDMAVLILDGPEIALTHDLIAECAAKNIVVVTSDSRHLPNGLLLPLAGHSNHTAVLRQQMEASLPSKKRIWQAIVKQKIASQADLVRSVGQDDGPLRAMAARVRSGDPDNVEATAAAVAFELVFGWAFLRNRDEPGLNAMLNYGYAILRAAVARAVVGAGLHPALGVHHHNRSNPLCLADDAMEPLRTIVDRVVYDIADGGPTVDDLVPPVRRRLIACLGWTVEQGGVRLPLLVGLERYAASLRRALCEGTPIEVIVPVFDST